MKVSERWNEAQAYITDHIQAYHLNHSYLEGHQWLKWNQVDNTLEALPEDLDRIQATINHMRSNTRALIAQLTQRHLEWECLPTSYDDATLRAARTAESIIRDYCDQQEWEVMREEHVRAALKGGTSAISVDWSKENNPVLSVLSVPEFVVEPGARRAETARWWIRCQLLPPKEVQAMFPRHFEERAPEPDGSQGETGSYTYGERTLRLTKVFTYYERPNTLCPEGRVLVEVNGQVVQAVKWNFPWKDRLNLVVATESKIENEAFGSTVLNDVISPQTALNAAWSSVLEHLRESSTHRMVADISWADQVDQMTDKPNQVMVGPMEQGKPEYMKAPGLPIGATEVIDRLKLEIDNLMGVHDVSRGQAPANIESGYGLSILAEKDSTPVGRLIKESARTWSLVAKMVLHLCEVRVTKEREATIHEGSGPVRRSWKGSTLMGQRNIKVPLDAIMPRSRAAQQQWAGEALQMGLISPEDPLAVMRFAKLADMPDQRSIIAATLPDAQKAIEENELSIMDEVPIPEEFDNHEIHMLVHNEFRKSRTYRELDKDDPRKKTIDDHVKSHQQMIATQLGQRRMGAQIDPILGEAPRADGAPAVAPLDAPPPPEALPEESGEEPIDADTAVSDMLAALEEPPPV